MGDYKDDGYAAEVEQLSQQVTELGVLAMETFKCAAAALFGPEPEAAHSAIAAAAANASVATDIHQKAVTLLARWTPTGPALQAIVNLQRTASECARMADHARRIAQAALPLSGNAEQELKRLAPDGPHLLAGLVRQGYIILRGCLILLAKQDRALARRVLAEDAELDRHYRVLASLLERAIASQPQRATPLHHLAFAAAEMRKIGTCVVAICDDRLA